MIQYLIAYLLADGTIAGLIGARTRPGRLQQKETLPAVTYTQVSRVAPHDRSSADGLAFTRWQLDVHARTYDQLRTIAAAIVARAQTYTRASAPKVSRVFVEAERDFDTDDFDELPYYRHIIDLQVIHSE